MARISENQKNVMADFFILNRKLIENKFSDSFTFEHGERLWNELGELLNVSGKAQKDVKKWKKTWDDLKRTIKDKAAVIKRDSLKTGNQPTNIILSPLASKIADIIGEVLISGDPEVHEVGINQTEVIVAINSVSPDKTQPSYNWNTRNENNSLIDDDKIVNEKVPLKQNIAPKKKLHAHTLKLLKVDRVMKK